MDNMYATTESGHFVEIIALRTDDNGVDQCQIVHHETDTRVWVKADTLTRLNGTDDTEDDALPEDDWHSDGYEGYSYI